jgi:hypothetical protein
MSVSAASPAAVGSPSDAVGDVVIETRGLAKVYRDFWGRQ